MSFGPTALAAFRASQPVQGRSVVYKRGETQIDALPVKLSRKEYQVTDRSGAITVWPSHDFAAAAEDLVLDEARIQPQRGDQIVDTFGGRVRTFEVSFPDAQQPPFRPADSDGFLLRIHSMLISDEAEA